ncbi:MAG: hypothetical protein IJ275_04005 [Ruminococcus sp.]|nr:hypothetical protein [Ruminococcus sp.]
MFYDNRNLAYDIRLFEEEEIRSSKVEAPQKKHADKPKKQQNTKVDNKSKSESHSVKRIKRRKNNFLNISLAVVFAVVIVAVVGLIIHGQVQLTELNQQISAAQGALEEQQSLYTQLEMKVDASISTAVVEKYAQENLGMTKVSNSQKEFISLSEGDKVELTMSDNDTVFDAIANAFSSLWS